ncbi:MAG: UDP-N-acetylmuramate--L-alanine ligase [Bacteroidetes bacterium]|nr:UDP-N-acetylmuramate--L-alanine ligase [Bacteroidota bacterium]
MDFKGLKQIYFLGIGGIGMSALARYFRSLGIKVAGYDKTRTPLTDQLEAEGIVVHYTDDPSRIPKKTQLVIYTPAVPSDLLEYVTLVLMGAPMVKRSEVLGWLAGGMKCIAVAGSHGKTTTSTLIAHLLHSSDKGCRAFLGGISKNYGTNYISDKKPEWMVAEADEYDRSFLKLFPDLAVVTSVDPDHLDIYKTKEALENAFCSFISQIRNGGHLVIKYGILPDAELPENVIKYTYGLDESADFHPVNTHTENGIFRFDLKTPGKTMKGLTLEIPGLINLENATAGLAVGWLTGIQYENLSLALADYKGVVRRLDLKYKDDTTAYIDDYAHHPEEIKACILSVRELYPEKKITGVFQPHLFTRTRDFADDFARSLEKLDSVILLEIYPARENPITGINSTFLLDKIHHPDKVLCSKENLVNEIASRQIEVLLTMGAGDIDTVVGPLVDLLTHSKQ